MSSQQNSCPLCNQSFPGDLRQLERHVNNHLDAQENHLAPPPVQQPTPSADNPQPNGSLHHEIFISDDEDEIQKVDPARAILRQVERDDAALAKALATADHDWSQQKSAAHASRFADCIEHCYENILRRIMPNMDVFDQSLKNIHLCARLDLYSSNIAGLGWDCGYRNIQMLFSCLLYHPVSTSILEQAGIREVPSIPEIAAGIESAWRNGFDPEGCASFGGTLTDKEVWIGATETFVFCRSLNLNAFVTDFETPTQAERKQMFQWIYKHFEQSCARRNCSLHLPRKARAVPKAIVCPIFCQWQGHSVTIVGAEKTTSGDIFLVVLDPSRAFHKSIAENRRHDPSLFLRKVDHPQFSHPRFQFVSVHKGKADEQSTNTGTRKRLFRRLRLRAPS